VPDKFTTGAGEVKLPWSVTVPVREPRAVGVNVTFTAQLAPTASEVPQVLVWAKSPLTGTPVIVTGRSPELVNVIACAALVVFSRAAAKVNEAGEAVARIAWPVPDKFTTGAGEVKVP